VLVAALTGNYGMGKSTVLKMFRDLGAITLDADKVVDALLEDAAVLRKVRESFGNAVFSKGGGIDRAALAAIIFRDKEERDALEGILHPLVFERIEAFLEKTGERKADGKVVIVEIPLLFEKGYTRRFYRKITVYTDEEIALKRLGKKGIAREMAMSRLEAQIPIKDKIRMADFSIDNSGTQGETERQVREIYGKLLADSKGMREQGLTAGLNKDE